ncbi:MAG: DNA-directed RNA polymerase sigma-70 factor [Pirellulaceae bacterium]|nr:MAG: DNA-directed RNA polymerase sigma-70 factor [Pirellulaceae bacterium]
MAASGDSELIARIRKGDQQAWCELVDRYEGRLFAFARLRVKERQAAEDLVQETFLGFLNSLPNYDGRPLENYLFAICGYKVTDYLRRVGRRPALAPLREEQDEAEPNWPTPGRSPSTIVRRGEQRVLEEKALAEVLAEVIRGWRRRGHWVKLQCLELLIVRGWPNQQVAKTLGLSEQQVANFKFDFIRTMRAHLKRSGLPAEVFPELYG